MVIGEGRVGETNRTEASASIFGGGVRVKSVSGQIRSPTGVVITNKLSLAAFIVLNVIDGILTKSLPAAVAYEFNPIMSHTGWVFWTVKLGITAIVTLGLLFFEPMSGKKDTYGSCGRDGSYLPIQFSSIDIYTYTIRGSIGTSHRMSLETTSCCQAFVTLANIRPFSQSSLLLVSITI